MVRSTASGYHLEVLLDPKLYRASVMKGSVPSFLLLDPDFAESAPIIEATNSETIVTGEGSVASEEPAAVEDDSASINANAMGKGSVDSCSL